MTGAQQMLGERMLGVPRQARVIHLRHAPTPRQPLSHGLRILALLTHAQGQRLEPPQHQPGLMGAEVAARQLEHLTHLRTARLRGRHHAAHHIAVTAQILGGRVHGVIRTPGQRLHQVGAGE